MKDFLPTSRAFSVRRDFSKFRSRNPGLRHSTRMKWKSVLSPYKHLTFVSMITFCAQLLVFDETFAQPDVCAVVNCSVVGLSVLTSMFQRAASHFTVLIFAEVGLRVNVLQPNPISTRRLIFLQLCVNCSISSLFHDFTNKEKQHKKPLRNKQTNC